MNAHEQLDHQLTVHALRRTTRLLMRWEALADQNDPALGGVIFATRHVLEHTPRIAEQVVEIHAEHDKARAAQ